jgi:hypothetical protein
VRSVYREKNAAQSALEAELRMRERERREGVEKVTALLQAEVRGNSFYFPYPIGRKVM